MTECSSTLGSTISSGAITWTRRTLGERFNQTSRCQEPQSCSKPGPGARDAAGGLVKIICKGHEQLISDLDPKSFGEEKLERDQRPLLHLIRQSVFNYTNNEGRHPRNVNQLLILLSMFDLNRVMFIFQSKSIWDKGTDVGPRKKNNFS